MFSLKQAVTITKAFPIERLRAVAVDRGPRPFVSGLKAIEVLNGKAVFLTHPKLEPWEWRALVGLHHG